MYWKTSTLDSFLNNAQASLKSDSNRGIAIFMNTAKFFSIPTPKNISKMLDVSET